MPDSVLGANLVDELVPDVIDGIREDLHPELGVRQFRMFLIERTYASGTIGDGPFVDAVVEVRPQPLVEPYMTEQKLEPCGIDEAGFVMLREVSMTFSEPELTGGDVDATDGGDFFIRLDDAHGQLIPSTYWRNAKRPFNDRIKDMGWIMKLVPASEPEL